ncbi:hypothetical protein QE152_g13223 [Popillia japonica]|uniref:Uncharacterized protein n=1 Tax=Popillia japonica TaxID=7064 RepID=A0AAW1LEY8_POPJA
MSTTASWASRREWSEVRGRLKYAFDGGVSTEPKRRTMGSLGVGRLKSRRSLANAITLMHRESLKMFSLPYLSAYAPILGERLVCLKVLKVVE